MFTTEKLNENITRIKDVAGTFMYLVEGTDRAMLIDTGVGAESLKPLVDQLTDKPYEVLITHGHMDHAMGASEFENVYMNPEDEEVYAVHSSPKMRLGYIKGYSMFAPDYKKIAKITADDLIPPKDFKLFKTVRPGDSFDLGGITLKTFEGKGHTHGILVILIPELRILILGDACNLFTFMFEQTSTTIETYQKTLKKLKADTDGLYDRILLFHGPNDAPMGVIDGVINVCQDIMDGNVDNVPLKSLGMDGLVAKTMDYKHFCRVDGGIGNVVYRKGGIFD